MTISPPLTIAKGESPSNWFSLINRTLTQARALDGFISKEGKNAILIKTKADFEKLLQMRESNPKAIGGMLGIEGGHALEGNIENIDAVYETGIRMIGPTHFFDNEFGGSAHGESGQGLSEFGRAAIERMNELGIFIDLAHSSPAIVEDVLNLSNEPVMVSHTGVRAVLDSQRNLSDEQIQRIAKKRRNHRDCFFLIWQSAHRKSLTLSLLSNTCVIW